MGTSAKKRPTATGKGGQDTDFSGESAVGALRELEVSTIAAADFLNDTKRAMPAGWMRVVWYKRPFVIAWVFVVVMWGYVRRGALAVRWAAGFWLRRRPGLLVQAAEVLLWPPFFIALSWYSNFANPFYINEGFPWPWLGVWLIALRYGALAGAVATILLLAAWYAIAPVATFPRLYFLGGAILTLICGEFGSLWGARSVRFREASAYQEDKIERLTRRLYLLKVSHDELEYELVDRPGTLRDALVELRALLDAASGETGKLPGATAIMEFLSRYCQIEAGALYAYIDGPTPVLIERARVGEVIPPNALDPMVVRAVETGQAVHLQEELMDKSRKLSLLAVAPVRDSRGNTIGILTVRRMPFLALNPDNLRTIWVLLQSYAEYLRLSHTARDTTRDWPESPMSLRHEFAWLQRLQLDHGMQSWCVLWRCQSAQALQVLEHIQREHTASEMAWLLQSNRHVVLVSLLAFVDTAQVKIQEQRMQDSLARSFAGQLPADAAWAEHIWLGSADAWTTLRQRVEQAQSTSEAARPSPP
jgi:polysaccharide biosynthesis protein PelD